MAGSREERVFRFVARWLGSPTISSRPSDDEIAALAPVDPLVVRIAPFIVFTANAVAAWALALGGSVGAAWFMLALIRCQASGAFVADVALTRPDHPVPGWQRFEGRSDQQGVISYRELNALLRWSNGAYHVSARGRSAAQR